MKHLLSLLHESTPNCPETFEHIAGELMNRYLLRVRDASYRIVECEFYFDDAADHKDPYVHGHERQRTTTGEWYFHGSGLDITLANGKAFGGILIRGIARSDGHGIPKAKTDDIMGPLNVCSEIFQQIGPVMSESPIHIGLIVDRDGSMTQARIFSFPRIGLNPAKETPRKYIDASYRFLSFLNLRHKGADQIRKILTGPGGLLSPAEYQQYYRGAIC